MWRFVKFIEYKDVYPYIPTYVARVGRYWNLLSRYIMAKILRYYYISRYFLIFLKLCVQWSECIIVVDTFIDTHCIKDIFRLFITDHL